MQLSEVGDINLTERTEVKTDTDMKETKKTREREELIMSHKAVDRKPLDSDGGIQPTFSASPAPESPNSVVNKMEEPNPIQHTVEREPFVLRSDFFTDWSTEEGMFIAVSSYEPDADDVMSLHDGEKVEVLADNDEDWWFVRKVFDDRKGMVPSRYLQDKQEFDRKIGEKILQQIEKISSDSSEKFRY